MQDPFQYGTSQAIRSASEPYREVKKRAPCLGPLFLSTERGLNPTPVFNPTDVSNVVVCCIQNNQQLAFHLRSREYLLAHCQWNHTIPCAMGDPHGRVDRRDRSERVEMKWRNQIPETLDSS